jgi:hypothetical protein
MDDDDEVINPDDLPRRILTDFAIYKDDGAHTDGCLLPSTFTDLTHAMCVWHNHAIEQA